MTTTGKGPAPFRSAHTPSGNARPNATPPHAARATAPPVYRPDNAPRHGAPRNGVTAHVPPRPPAASHVAAAAQLTPRSRPSPPPAYRPERTNTAPAQARMAPPHGPVQARPASQARPLQAHRPGAAAAATGVVQPMSMSWGEWAFTGLGGALGVGGALVAGVGAMPLVGLGLLAWVLSRLDLRAMGAALGRVSLAALALSCASFSFNFFLKAYRWHRLLLAQGIVLPPAVSLAAYLSGQFYAQVTLGRVGEFFRIEALFERNVGAGAALASSIFDRLLDLFVVLLTGGVFAVFVLGGRVEIALLVLASVVAGALLLRALLFSLGSRSTGRVQRALSGLSHRPWLGRIAKLVRDLAEGMQPMMRIRPLTEALVWTFVPWVFYFNALFVLADALGLDVSRTLLTATAAVSALAALLPITISGLGARELIYITALGHHGVPGEPAAVLALLHLFVMSASAICFGLLGVGWRQRQRL